MSREEGSFKTKADKRQMGKTCHKTRLSKSDNGGKQLPPKELSLTQAGRGRWGAGKGEGKGRVGVPVAGKEAQWQTKTGLGHGISKRQDSRWKGGEGMKAKEVSGVAGSENMFSQNVFYFGNLARPALPTAPAAGGGAGAGAGRGGGGGAAGSSAAG